MVKSGFQEDKPDSKISNNKRGISISVLINQTATPATRNEA